MSNHNYTNPAFCQKSEFYSVSPSRSQQQKHSLESSTILCSEGGRNGNNCGSGSNIRIQRSESTRSFHTVTKRKYNNNNTTLDRSLQHNYDALPPKPGPKPSLNQNHRTGPFDMQRSGSGRYALVPLEELSTAAKDRYAIVPASGEQNGSAIAGIGRKPISKSQDNIDRYSHFSIKDEPASFHEECSDTFTSLPPIIGQDENRLKAAFSSDFGSKSFVLVDQKSNLRYAVVPTAEDEDIVDDNHEIIQMHNGRTHRYAVIPTDEEETCLSNSDISHGGNHSYSTIPELPRQPLQSSTPQKRFTQHQQQQQQQQQSNPGTPLKNPAATKKLQEILSTPRKVPLQRANSMGRYTPRRYQSQQIFMSNRSSTPKQEFTPQRLQYETKQAYLEARTTAVITPRVAQSNHHDDEDSNSLNKTWNESYPQKVANATATLGVVSLMLILGSGLNSGLCLYMIAHIGRSFYLEFSLAAAIAGVGLGILGYRSRHCDWLPNRSYVSGYILVTVFCLLKCCGLLVLMALVPIPGTPLHDVTTGVVLGLSTFTIFFIGLGVIGSYWCYRPPPDNRVNVC